MSISESTIVQAVDASVVETVEAFIRFRPGFHGDTGVRDYLYHRLMTNLPDGGRHRRTDGGGTLLVQAEWYTVLMDRGKGSTASSGRFDIGIPNPEDLVIPDPQPLVAFECGRATKRLKTFSVTLTRLRMTGGPKLADITKLFREIRCAGLPYGYALEFYDEGQGDAQGPSSVGCGNGLRTGNPNAFTW